MRTHIAGVGVDTIVGVCNGFLQDWVMGECLVSSNVINLTVPHPIIIMAVNAVKRKCVVRLISPCLIKIANIYRVYGNGISYEPSGIEQWYFIILRSIKTLKSLEYKNMTMTAACNQNVVISCIRAIDVFSCMLDANRIRIIVVETELISSPINVLHPASSLSSANIELWSRKVM